MLVDKKAAIALKEPSVLTSATVRAAERLQIKNAALARILGVSDSTVSRMRNKALFLERGDKPFELAILFVRLYRSNPYPAWSMSSPISTRAELLSNSRAATGTCWRVVEAQNQISTAKLTDSADEQHVLELLIEEAKPPVPPECQHLNFLLFTPFRYGAPYPRGSRFMRTGFTTGVY